MSARSRSKRKSLRRSDSRCLNLKRSGGDCRPSSRHSGGTIMTILKTLTAAAIVATLAAGSAYAQAQRLAGEIKRVEGNLVFADGRDGKPVTIKLTDNGVVTAV